MSYTYNSTALPFCSRSSRPATAKPFNRMIIKTE